MSWWRRILGGNIGILVNFNLGRIGLLRGKRGRRARKALKK
jgi:hypothetical protein